MYDIRTVTYDDKRGRAAQMESESVRMGRRLRAARVNAGVSTVAAARALGVRRPAIWEMETARRRCQANELSRLADLYGVSLTYLLGQRSARARDDRASLAADVLANLSDDALKRLEKAIAIVKERRSKARYLLR
jgi:transcriptional regulator with XRE-family HTH domain